MKSGMAMVGALAALVCACGAPSESASESEAVGRDDAELALLTRSTDYVALGRCGAAGESVAGLAVNGGTASTCLAGLTFASGADGATRAALPTLGVPAARQLFRVTGGDATHAPVSDVFALAGDPPWPLDAPVDGQRFFQATASSCDAGAWFAVTPLNDAGFLGKNVQRAFGIGDIVVSYAPPEMPATCDLDCVRREVMWERAAFRGTVERPTFDILHPFAKRPLLVTVFELLPRVRTDERCPGAPLP